MTTLTQAQLESLDDQEYSNLLAYGDPLEYSEEVHTDHSNMELTWISTLDSTTFLGLTFGYSQTGIL